MPVCTELKDEELQQTSLIYNMKNKPEHYKHMTIILIHTFKK